VLYYNLTFLLLQHFCCPLGWALRLTGQGLLRPKKKKALKAKSKNPKNPKPENQKPKNQRQSQRVRDISCWVAKGA